MGQREDAPYIEVEGLTLKTPMGMVYSNATFEVEKGQVCALFGDAGSGKTALALTMCGRMKPSSGTARVGEYNLFKQYRLVRRKSSISFIPGLNDVQPFLRVKNIMAAELSLAGKHGNKENTDEFLKRCNFFDKRDVRFDDLDAYDTAYFGIMLACAYGPELLCVDDVQSDLTQYQGVKLVNILRTIAKTTNATVLFNCSEYEIARHADGIVVMTQGAEAQRQAVIRDTGDDALVPIMGIANDVMLNAQGQPAQERYREPELSKGGAR